MAGLRSAVQAIGRHDGGERPLLDSSDPSTVHFRTIIAGVAWAFRHDIAIFATF
jgi:hypothetical protein